MEVFTYKDNKTEAQYYLEDGKKFGKKIKHGLCKSFHKNGCLSYTGSFEHNKKVGEHKVFFFNGKLRICAYFKDNMNHGLYESFYNNGQRKTIGTLEDGQWNGKYSKWDRNGNLRTECFYDKNTRFDSEEDCLADRFVF